MVFCKNCKYFIKIFYGSFYKPHISHYCNYPEFISFHYITGNPIYRSCKENIEKNCKDYSPSFKKRFWDKVKKWFYRKKR